MTSREMAFKAVGFLQGFSANAWQDYDDGVAESYDKAIKVIESYVDQSTIMMPVKPNNPMGGWITTTCECAKADSLDGALS